MKILTLGKIRQREVLFLNEDFFKILDEAIEWLDDYDILMSDKGSGQDWKENMEYDNILFLIDFKRGKVNGDDILHLIDDEGKEVVEEIPVLVDDLIIFLKYIRKIIQDTCLFHNLEIFPNWIGDAEDSDDELRELIDEHSTFFTASGTINNIDKYIQKLEEKHKEE